jgi:hypothetical protein
MWERSGCSEWQVKENTQRGNNRLVVTHWNANKLKKKLGTAKFRNIIKNMDIIGLVEIWMEEKDEIRVDSFGCVSKLRIKSGNKGDVQEW